MEELNSNREIIKKKLIEKYFAELPENEYTQVQILLYVKYMVKNLIYGKLNSKEDMNETMEETTLLDWVMELDSSILVEIA